MIRLARFQDDLSSPAFITHERFFSNFGVRWNIYEFGMQRMEFIVNARDVEDTYTRYAFGLGKRYAAYLPDAYRPVTGWVSEIQRLSAAEVKYVVKGAAWRGMYSELDTTTYTTTDDIATTIGTILTDHVPVDSGSTTNIASNATTLGGWQPQHPQGSYPGDLIKDLLTKSDGSNNIYDFWFVDEPFGAGTLQLFEPYYQARSDSASIDWRVRLKDLRDITLARNIDNIVTTATVYYGLVTGSATGGSETQLQDTAADFIVDGVSVNDQVTHLTDGGNARVVSVDSATQLTISEMSPKVTGTATGGSATELDDSGADFVNDGVVVGDKVFNTTDDSEGTATSVTATKVTCSGGFSGGTNNAFNSGDNYRIVHQFASGDNYSIRTQAQVKSESSTVSTTQYWTKERAVFERTMDSTQAAQYVSVLASDDAEQVQAFTISSRWIRDGNNARHHLFDVIVNGGGYIQVEDLYPTTALSSTSRDKKTTFFITALDYNETQGTLRVMVDNPDRRLDARLRRANILDSEGVSI